jgi:glucokinase-like ROK family protein
MSEHTPSEDFVLNSAEAEVLDAIRKAGALSRSDLARELDVSRASVSAVASKLLDVGILCKAGTGESQGGRRPLMLEVNGDFGYVAGVDMGATSIDLVLADFVGNVLERCDEPADVRDRPEQVLGRMCALILDMIKARGTEPKQVIGVGIGVPGPVEFSRGVLIAPPLMPTWESFPIRDFVRQTFPVARVMVDNDVNVMAIGESHAGAARGVENFIFIKIGTGIGGGIICKGEIYRGSDGCAGDVGHICVDYNGPTCQCGNVGCLEAMAAGPPIATRAREVALAGKSDFLAKRLEENGGVLTAIDVGEAAAAGDQVAIQIINESGRMIGGMLAGLVNFFNPSVILIGGGVSSIGHRLLSAIRQAVLRRSTALSTRRLRIEYSPLGADAGVIGATRLALQHIFAVQD